MNEYLSFNEHELLRLIKKHYENTFQVKFNLVLNFKEHVMFSSPIDVINIAKALEIRNYIKIINIKETPVNCITLLLTEKALNEFNKPIQAQY